MSQSSDKRQFRYQLALQQAQYDQNRQLTAYQNDYNAEQAALAFQRNQQAAAQAQSWQQQNMNLESQLAYNNWKNSFDEQNAYNDPSAQRERLIAAGYNPQLAMGSVNTLGGSGFSSSASSGAPSFSAPSATGGSSSVGLGSSASGESPDSLNYLISALSQIVDSSASATEKYSQIQYVKANARKTAADAFHQELENFYDSQVYRDSDGNSISDDNGQPLTLAGARQRGLVNNIIETGNKLKADTNLSKKQLDYYQTQIDSLKAKYPLEAANLSQTLTNLEHELDEIDARTGLAEEQTEYYKSVGANVDFQTQRARALLPYEKRKFAAETKLLLEKSKTEKSQRAYLASGETANYASAELSREQTHQVRQLMKQNGYRFYERMNILIDTAKNNGYITKSRADQLQYELNRYYNFRQDTDGNLGWRLSQGIGIFLRDTGMSPSNFINLMTPGF